MEKINFVNNSEPEISAENLNKMQSNIEDEFSNIETYSEDETFTGKYWIDGKKIYRKVIHIASLPNTKDVSYAAGLTGCNVIKVYGYARYNIMTFPLPFVGISSDKTGDIPIYINGDNIMIKTYTDRSAFSGHIIVEYVKTT